MSGSASYDRGFVLRWRKSRKSVLGDLRFVDREVFWTCVDLANWEPKEWFDGQKIINIPRGSFVTTQRDLAAETPGDGKGKHPSRQNVRTALRRLVSANLLKINPVSNQTYTFITVVNYSLYNDKDARTNQGANHEPTTSQPRANHELTLTEQDQQYKQREQEQHVARLCPPTKKKKKVSVVALEVAEYLGAAIQELQPGEPVNPESWALDIDRAIRIDKRTPEALKHAIDWIYREPAGSFWIPNIRSGAKLREKFGTLQAQAMRDSKPKKQPPRDMAAELWKRAQAAEG